MRSRARRAKVISSTRGPYCPAVPQPQDRGADAEHCRDWSGVANPRLDRVGQQRSDEHGRWWPRPEPAILRSGSSCRERSRNAGPGPAGMSVSQSRQKFTGSAPGRTHVEHDAEGQRVDEGIRPAIAQGIRIRWPELVDGMNSVKP